MLTVEIKRPCGILPKVYRSWRNVQYPAWSYNMH